MTVLISRFRPGGNAASRELAATSQPSDTRAAAQAEILSSPNALPREMVEFILEQGMDVQHLGWHLVRWGDAKDDTPGWRAIQQANVIARYGKGRSFLAMYHQMLETLRAQLPGAPELEGWSRDEIARAVEPGVLDGMSIHPGIRKDLELLNNAGALANVEPTDRAHKWILRDSDGLGRFMERGRVDNDRAGVPFDLLGLMHDPADPVDAMNFERNLMNRSFWKLYGFLDRVWREFLEAKGLAMPQDAIEFHAQLWEMLRHRDEVPPSLEPYSWLLSDPGDGERLPLR
jgi:hypothetical protein